MKVYIGGYINRISWGSDLETWYYKKMFPEDHWDRDLKDFTWFGKTFIWLTDQLQILLNMSLNKIQDKRERKIKVRVDNYDVWNADHTLAVVIYPILQRLKEDKMGIPFVEAGDAPEELFSDKVDEHDFSEKAWEYVLDEMIWTFGQLADPNSDDEFYKEVPGSDHPFGRYELDREGYDKREERIKNGLRLFGRYYRGLWT